MELWGGKKLKIRRCLFAFLILVTAMCYHGGFLPELFSVPSMILLSLTVSIAMHEKSIPSMFFGLFAGALWDLGSGQRDGFFAIMLTATGFLVGTLTTFIMRNNIRANIVLNLLFSAICNVSYWLLFFVRKGYDDSLAVLLSYYLPSVLLTAGWGILQYYVISYIVKHTKEKKQH